VQLKNKRKKAEDHNYRPRSRAFIHKPTKKKSKTGCKKIDHGVGGKETKMGKSKTNRGQPIKNKKQEGMDEKKGGRCNTASKRKGSNLARILKRS